MLKEALTDQNMVQIRKVAVIGAGNIGGAIAAGMAAGGSVSPADIIVTARTSRSLDRVRAICQEITGHTDNRLAVEGADLVVLAVKPWQADRLAAEIKDHIDYRRTVIASVIAGLSFSDLYEMFGRVPDNAMYRIIPNTAISQLKSTTFIAADREDASVSRQIDSIFRNMGEVIWVEENLLPYGMALASCGIAYALRYIEASIAGGVSLGLPEDVARRAVIGTVDGAAALLRSGGMSPRHEIDRVATPGGYTAKGLQALDENGFPDAVAAALHASAG